MKHDINENKASHLKIGQLGEDIAVKHLVKHRFKILERNYKKKWGEIDIIATKDRVLHFIEVKTVSCETDFNEHLPEENIHFQKKKRLARAVQTYLAEKKVTHETSFNLSAIIIFFDLHTEKSKMRIIENIIL